MNPRYAVIEIDGRLGTDQGSAILHTNLHEVPYPELQRLTDLFANHGLAPLLEVRY